MGALHAGHISLIDAARRECDCVVVSIFVNPSQFNNAEDYKAYTRDLPADLDICAQHAVEFVFAPGVGEMYPTPQEVVVEVPETSRYLCGEFRPGHFRGVATVVTKLFNIVQPEFAYFGEKDAQQLAVIRVMVAQLNMPVTIRGLPTVREPDGLAMSSRNQRLTPAGRLAAPILFKALQAAKTKIESGTRNSTEVKAAGLSILAETPRAQVDYFEIVDGDHMQPITNISGSICIAAAIWLDGARLIDNVFVFLPDVSNSSIQQCNG